MNEPPEGPESPDTSRWIVRSADDVRIERSVESDEVLGIDELAEALGYVESAELQALRSAWVEAIRARLENAREFAIAYQEKAEAAYGEHQANFGRGRERFYDWMMRDEETDTGESEESVLANAAALGYTETSAMRAVRARIDITLSLEPTEESSIELAKQVQAYQVLANECEGIYGAKFQIGMLLAKATVQRDGGEMDYYYDDLGDAQDYATGMGFADVVIAIDRELNPEDT